MRTLSLASLALIGLALSFSTAEAADPVWPPEAVRLEVPWAPGGTVDFTARIVAQQLGVMTGKSFIVENKPGAAGGIGYNFVARAAPDGQTALVFDASYATVPSLFSNIPWDYENGLVPVCTVLSTPLALVVPVDSPYKTTQQLIDYARANPGKLNFGSGGVGSTPHMAGEMFKRAAGVQMTHIPFKGGGDALLGVMTGSADVLFTATPTALAQFKAGKVRVLAVTGSHRLASFADVPTVGETVKGYVFENWYGIAMPKGTSPAVIAQFSELVAKVVKDPAIKQRIEEQGGEVSYSSSAAFGKLMKDEAKRYGEIAASAGIKPE